MFQITKQQADERWDILPINLREILCSPEQGKIIWDIGKSNHLIDEKIGRIAGLTGYVVMGFMHPEDLAKEIRDTLNLNSEIADSIAKEIEKKIFAPIRSEIDKVYAPAAAVGLEAMERGPAQKTAKEENIIDLKTFQKQEVVTEKEEIVEKPAEIKKELTAVPLPNEAIHKTEVEPIGPVIIHKEIETKPTLGKQRSLGGLFGFLKSQKEGEKIQEQKPITAEVEIPILDMDLHRPDTDLHGKKEIDKTMTITMTLPPAPPKVEPPKVVHYSELKTPVKPMPEVPMPPKPFDAVPVEGEARQGRQGGTEIKSKVFESEIEKAKAAGLIVNNQQLTTNNLQLKIGEIPIEIEEVSRQSFFSRIFQFLTGLFVIKKKVIKEIPEQKENLISKLAQEKNKKEIEEKPTLRRDSGREEFKFPIEIKLPESFDAAQGKPFGFAQGKPSQKEPELPKPEIPELKTDIFQTKELEPPEVHEARENPQPIAPQPALSRVEGPEKPKTQNEEVIDLRTFERIKKE